MNEQLVTSSCIDRRMSEKNYIVVNAAEPDVFLEEEHLNFDPLLNTKEEIDSEEDVLKMIEEVDKEDDAEYLEDEHNNEIVDSNDSDDDKPRLHFQNSFVEYSGQPSGSRPSSRKRKAEDQFETPCIQHSNSVLFSKYYQIVQKLAGDRYPRCDRIEAICKICKKILKGSGQVTSNFTRHLRFLHTEDYEDYVKSRTNDNTKLIQQEDFDKLVVRFIAEEILPISIADSAAFRKLITFANPILSVPNRSKVDTMINSEYSSMVTRNQRLIKRNGDFCTTADIWTINQKSYLGYTIHWLDDFFNRQSKALGCKRFSGSQAVDRINNIIIQIHAEYGLNKSNVRATITDNATNFMKAFKDLGIDGVHMSNEVDADVDEQDEKLVFGSIPYDVFNSRLPRHIRCATYSLNLVASKDFYNILKKNNRWFNRHEQIMHKCSCLWINANKGTTSEQILGCQLKYPVATVWNSLFDSIKDLLKHRLKINQLMNPNEEFTESDFNYLEEYLDLLSPITEAVEFLQKNKEMVYGFLLPTLARTRTKYQAMIADQSLYKSQLACSLLKSIQSRFSNYYNLTEDVNDAIVASVLCPQAKTKWISTLNPRFKGTKINEVVNLVKETVSRESGEVFSLQTVNEDESVNFFDFEANLESHTSVSAKQSEKEFCAYLNDNSLSFSMLNKYKIIKSVFLKYNSPLPSSAAVERLFSFPELIHSSRGESFSESNFEKFILLKANSGLK